MNNIKAQTDSLQTIRDFIRFAYTQFAQSDLFYGHGTDNAWDEAVALVLQTLELPHDIPEHWLDSRIVEAEKKKLSERLVSRIEKRIPLAYLTHKAWFAGIEFYVDDRVLVPRSPIAELIENEFAPWLDMGQTQTILDLCTGSGCIALACGLHFPHCEVIGSDISKSALEVAELNKQKLGAENVQFIESDGLKQIPARGFDLIVSNPPYVDAADFAAMPEEYKSEPKLGLVSGEDGLDFTRALLREAANYLSENGVLIVEVGNSAPALEQAFPDLPLIWIEFERGGDGVFVLDKAQLMAWAG